MGNDQLSGNRFSYLQYYKSSDGMTTYFGETEAGYTSYLVEGVFANPNLTWRRPASSTSVSTPSSSTSG